MVTMDIEEELRKLNRKLDRLTGFSCPEADLEITLDEWLKVYKRDKVKEGTYYQYTLWIRNLPPELKQKRLRELGPLQLQRFLLTIKAGRQRQHYYGLLLDAFQKAFLLQMIAFNPMRRIEKPRHEKKPSFALDRKQEAAFVRACRAAKYGPMYLIMLFAGLRKGEAMALTAQDIDLDKRALSVTKTVNELGHIGSPKSKAGIRTVPILDNLFPYLEPYASRSGERLFPLNDCNAHKHFVRILEAAGLGGLGFTTHSLRHTFITRCCENGVPPKVTQKWVGHSTVQMTLNVYAHCNRDFEEQVIAELNRKLRSQT